MKAMIREWIKDYLGRNGLPVLEIPGNVRGVDVLTRSGTKALAICLAMDKISLSERNAITGELRQADIDVLWITHHCDWLDQAPGVGIRTFLTPQPRIPTTQIGNVYVCVDVGLFAAGSIGLMARKQPLALQTVLERYLNRELFAFTSQAPPKAPEERARQVLGFATPAALQVQHQALQRGLFTAKSELRESREQLQTLRRESSTIALKHAQELKDQEAAKGALSKTIAILREELEATKGSLRSTRSWVADVEAARASSALVRMALQPIMPLKAGQTTAAAPRWTRSWPWLMAAAFFFLVPAASVAAGTLPDWTRPWAPVAAAAAITLSGLLLLFGWCWAKDHANGRRCTSKRRTLFGRCPHRGTHGMNVFDLLGFGLLCLSSVIIAQIVV
ncbi:hypothetical protein [Paenarthrobacter aromaticivorans]|uniref:hypothetical protein n=1 Tax=Paenarthrobacter aromaticivorans TaxID=2849150 RepID=UPI003A804292